MPAGKRRVALHKARLTTRTVADALPERKRYILWDETLTGFGVRVSPTGRRSFIVQFRTAAPGRATANRKQVPGHFPAMAVHTARRRARGAAQCRSLTPGRRGHRRSGPHSAQRVGELPRHPARVLVNSPYELITPADHPLAALARDRAHPRDLQGHALVAHTRASYIRVLGEMFLNRHGVAPNVVVGVDGWEVIKNCVECGIGIAVVPILCLTDRDRVCRVPLDADLAPRRYGTVTHRERILPLAVRRFMQVLDVAPKKTD